jgi:hypothetical protein
MERAKVAKRRPGDGDAMTPDTGNDPGRGDVVVGSPSISSRSARSPGAIRPRSASEQRRAGQPWFETQSNGADTISHLRSTGRVQTCTDMALRLQVLAGTTDPVCRADSP